MLDTLRKTFLAGSGVIAFSRERLEQAIDALVACGDLTVEQGRKVRDSLLARGEGEGRQLLERVQTEVERILGLGPLATKSELRAMEARIADLERRASGLAPQSGHAENLGGASGTGS